MTQQVRDIIKYKNKRYFLGDNWIDILEPYFEKYPERRVEPENYITCCWRGYFAEFKISYKVLYITSLKIMGGSEEEDGKSIIDVAFPDSKKYEFLSGFLTLHKKGFSYYIEEEPYLVLEIENGNLVRELRLDAEEYRALQESNKSVF